MVDGSVGSVFLDLVVRDTVDKQVQAMAEKAQATTQKSFAGIEQAISAAVEKSVAKATKAATSAASSASRAATQAADAAQKAVQAAASSATSCGQQVENTIGQSFSKSVAIAQSKVVQLEKAFDAVTYKLDGQWYSGAFDSASKATQKLLAEQEKLMAQLEAAQDRLAIEVQAAAQKRSAAEQKAARQAAAALEREARKSEAAQQKAAQAAAKAHEQSAARVQTAYSKAFSGAEKQSNSLGRSARSFGSRLKSIVSGALVFNLLSSALRKMTDYLGTAVTSSSAMRDALSNLKGAAQQAAAPIIQAITPALVTLTNAAATAISYIAQLFAALSGKSLSQLSETAKGFNNTAKAAGKLSRSVAGFDQITKLSNNSGGSSDSITPNYDFSASSPMIEKFAEKIKGYLKPLQEIDLSPLKESLKGLWEGFKKFAGILGGVFSWAWHNILVPLAEWFIEKAAPASVDALTAAFEGLSSTVSVIFDAIKECWDKLKPIFSWIGDTALVILEDLKEIGEGVANKWEKNREKLKKTFENIGTVIQKVWAIIGPIFTWLRDAISTIAVDLPLNELQHIFDSLFAISEVLAGIFSGDIKQVFNGFGAAIAAEMDYAEAQTKTFASALGIDLDAADQWVKQTTENIGQWFSAAWDKIVGIWEGVASWFNETVIVPLQEFWAPIGEWFGELFGGIEQTLSDVFYNIGVIAEGCWEIIKYAWELASGWFDANVVQPVAGFFEETWASISAWATDAWANIKEAFRPVAEWFDENVIQPVSRFFTDLWEGFLEKATEAWEAVKKVFVDIGQWGKDILNELIGALNSGLTSIFGGINKGLAKIKDLQVGDVQPFANIRTISIPQIPMLANGGVITQPTLAMMGEYSGASHNPEIAAPQSVIEQTLAKAMGGHYSNMVQCFEAVVDVLKDILDAIYGIDFDRDAIYDYIKDKDRWMAIMRGG